MNEPQKRCTIGKACGSSCVSRGDKCTKTLEGPLNKGLSKAADFLSKELSHIGEHLAINVASWKVGKVLGPAVSGYLEHKYGIPREQTERLSETIIQATSATALNIRHMKKVEDVAKSLIVESMAAYLGKTAHFGAESFLDSVEGKETLKNLVPLLSGKVAGVATATLGAKSLNLSQIANYVSRKYKEDLRKLSNVVSKGQVSFSEEGGGVPPEVLGEISLLALLLSYKRPELIEVWYDGI